MILFNETMLDENTIFMGEIVDNFNSKKVYIDSTLRVCFIPELKTPSLHYSYKTHEDAVSQLNQLTVMINLQKK